MEDLQEVLDFWFTLAQDEVLTPAPDLVAKAKEKFLKIYTKYKNSITLNLENSQEYLALVVLFFHLPKIMFSKTEEIHATDGFAITLAEIAVERGYDLQIQQGKSLLYKPLLASSNVKLRKLGKQLLKAVELEEDIKLPDSKILNFPQSSIKEESPHGAKADIVKTATNQIKETPKKAQEPVKETNTHKGKIVIPIQPNSQDTLLITQQSTKNTLLATSNTSEVLVQQPSLLANKESIKQTEHDKEVLKKSSKNIELKDAKEEITVPKIKPNLNKIDKESIKHSLNKHQLLHNKHFHHEKEKHEFLKKNNDKIEHTFHHAKHLHVNANRIKHHNHDEKHHDVKTQKIQEKIHNIHKHNLHTMPNKNHVVHHNTPAKSVIKTKETLLKQHQHHNLHEEKTLNKIHEKEHLITANKDKTKILHHDDNHKNSHNLVPNSKVISMKEQDNKERIHKGIKSQHVAEVVKKVVKEVENINNKEKQEDKQNTASTKDKTTKVSSVTIISNQPKVITDICNVKETINTTPKTNLGNVVN